MSAFGVVVTCCAGDLHLARGCCASIRHFLADVPIALLVDGDVDVEDLERTYGAIAIRNEDVTDPSLRASCFGWGRTTMVALWEAPWPTFLLVDADTLIWSDVLRHARFDLFDMITDRHVADAFPDTAVSLAFAALLGEAELAKSRRKHRHVRTWCFDASRLGEAVPGIEWGGTADRLFCGGAVFARRGVLSQDRFLALVEMGHRTPGLFSRGNMGVFNALVIEAGIRVDQRSDLQQLVHMSTRADLARRFPVDRRSGPQVGREALVIHWAGGLKPTLDGRLAYSDPMTFFRRQFLKDRGLVDRDEIDAVIAAEDEVYRDLHPSGPTPEVPRVATTGPER
jgi:hypothetical protein